MNTHIRCISVILNINYAQLKYRFSFCLLFFESLSYNGKPKGVQTSDYLIQVDSKETHDLLSTATTQTLQSRTNLEESVNSHWLKLNNCNKREVRICTVGIFFPDRYFINRIDMCIGFSNIDLIDIS